MTMGLEACQDHPEEGYCEACGWRLQVRVRWRCSSCRDPSGGPGYAPFLHHPATTAFLYDHGVLAERDRWAFIALGGHVTEHVESADPVRVTYTLEYDGDGLSMTFGEDGSVVAID